MIHLRFGSQLLPFLVLLVDLCHPLLVGVSSDNEGDAGEGRREGRSGRREAFLRVKQGLLLEVDVQHGRERCRLELGSLARVEAAEAAWTRGVRGGTEGWINKYVEREYQNYLFKPFFLRCR